MTHKGTRWWRETRTVGRVAGWTGLVAILCGVAVIVIPDPTQDFRAWNRTWPEAAAQIAGRQRAQAAHDDVNRAALHYRAWRTLAAWEAAGPGASGPITLDASIAPDLRAGILEAARRAWPATVGEVGMARAGLFVTWDTGGISMASLPRPLGGPEIAYFALPVRTDGARCIALIRLQRWNAGTARGITLGPCAFYARFGAPGPRIGEWIEETAGLLAMQSDAQPSSGPPGTSMPLLQMSPASGACVVRGGDFCLAALGLRDDPWRARTARGPEADSAVTGLIGSARATRQPSLGSRQAYLLGDLARDIGPDRFAQFWRSGESPEAAFESATGQSMADWTRRWLGASTGPLRREALVSLPSVAWEGAALVMLIAVSRRRRASILAGPGR